MAKVELLCMANSFKRGGCCIAGIRLDTGAWLRPVAASANGALTNADCLLDVGRVARPLDIVRISLDQPSPRPHQPEDWLLNPARWRLRQEASLDVARRTIEPLVLRGPDLFGTRGPSIPEAYIVANGVPASLCVVQVASPSFYRVSRMSGGTQLRVTFELGGTQYDLPVTDNFLPESLRTSDRVDSKSNWYFTVSLGEPFNGSCYKLVAAVFEIT